MCDCCVCASVCTSMSWSRWQLQTRPWGPWTGPPLVRLLALNRASGRFPFSLLSPSPTPRPAPWPSPCAGLHSSGRSRARDRTRCAAALPESMNQGGERPWLPFSGGGTPRWGSGLLPPASPSWKEGGRRFPRGGQGPGFSASLHVQLLERPRPHATCPCSPERGLLP